ncbi:MAG: glycosyltransferase family 92 protein [Selenomonadaceae bacterium]|nr:glycosyltransferase family 92 protein [Selenomonadaceae bacterium]
MSVDKNLFLYELAVAAIMKNEAPYLQEWLDYHLLAGVEHFYIYDNEDSDAQKKILQPYIERGFVTHIPYPGRARQYEAYNDAVQKYRFFCRYMAFIDGDEFILPRGNRSIVEVADEIFSANPDAASIGMNMFYFGSNGQTEADYSRGVLERFTRRAPRSWKTVKWVDAGHVLDIGNFYVKQIVNPRAVNYVVNGHTCDFIFGKFKISEHGERLDAYDNPAMTADRISVNHYFVKSREEYLQKLRRGAADGNDAVYQTDDFKYFDRNEEFDDEILSYRNFRAGLELRHETDEERNSRAVESLIKALTSDLKNLPLEGKIENYLVCLALSRKFQLRFGEVSAEEFSLLWLNGMLRQNFSFADFELLLSELPEILRLKYPAAENIRRACIKIIEDSISDSYRAFNVKKFRQVIKWRYAKDLLKAFDSK